MKKIPGIMVLLAVFSGLAFAQPAELQPEHERMPPFYAQYVAGKGFALAEDGGFHVLGVKVVKRKNLPPGLIMRMLREHRSLEEIISALREMQGKSRLRGFMSFAGEHYVLNITEATRDSLAAVVVKPPVNGSGEPSVVGSIALTVEEYEGSRIATGTLEMDGVTYEALLHVFQGKKIPRKVAVPKHRGKWNIPGAWEKMPRPRGPPF
jgi:hypothetical protein